MIKSFSARVIIGAIFGLGIVTATYAQEIKKRENLGDLISIGTPDGWKWSKHKDQFNCFKKGETHGISVWIYEESHTVDAEVEKLAHEYRQSFLRSAKNDNRVRTLSEIQRIGRPHKFTWVCSGKVGLVGKEVFEKHYVFCTPKLIVIYCTSPEEKIFKELVRIVESSVVTAKVK